VTTRDQDYQLMMSALAQVAKRRDEELSSAEEAYQDHAARAAGELARAEGEATAADSWAGAAAGQVLDVDREAGRLWEQLRRGRGMRTLGELPDPLAIEAMPRVAIEAGHESIPETPRQSARTLLARASDRIDVTVRPAFRGPLPRWLLPLLPVAGALVAAAAGLFAAGLVTLGDQPIPGGAALRLIGWLIFVIAPSAGVPMTAVLAHRRNARLDITGVGLTLLGGMISATLLSLLFLSNR
jgi:hypothetical protein